MSGQKKLYKAGEKKPGGEAVKQKPIEGTASKTRGGKTHKVANRTVNHSRGPR